MTVSFADLSSLLAEQGLSARGGFRVEPEDQAPETCRTVILVGNTDSLFWSRFTEGRRDEADPLDAWTKRVVDRIAAMVGGWAVYPSDGPPYFPFQRWAQKMEPVYSSPLGLLIHSEFGLWHAYRAAICLHWDMDVPPPEQGANPCLSCDDQPCLNTCPVNAFDGQRYDVPSCAGHLRSALGKDCLEQGCRARRACPIAGPELYAPGQAGFHMKAFLASRDSDDRGAK